jgi:hypothetical protein
MGEREVRIATKSAVMRKQKERYDDSSVQLNEIRGHCNQATEWPEMRKEVLR